MSGFQLILSSDTIEQGRIKINNAFSATTGLWSGSTGTQSLIHNNETGNLAIGYYAIASGSGTTANGLISFATNKDTTAYGDFSHAEGDGTYAGGLTSHAEGLDTTASGDYSHSEGTLTTAFGENSHAEGYRSSATGNTSHAEGGVTKAWGDYSHAEGFQTTARGANSHAEGDSSIATGTTSHAEGYQTKAWGNYSHSEGNATTAIGLNSHAEGNGSQATGNTSHAEGFATRAWGDYSHAEGYQTTALSIYSHTEGRLTTASGNTSHAEGIYTVAGGSYSHAGGVGLSTARVIANGYGSFAHFRRTSTTSTIGALADNSAILGGTDHSIDSTSSSSFIVGGEAGIINAVSLGSGVVGGSSNTISGGLYSSILGGTSNLIDNSLSSAIIGGDNITINTVNNIIALGGSSYGDSGLSGDNQIIGGVGSRKFRVNLQTGQVYGVGAFNTSGADYSEYFEWNDLNLNNENRIGYFVSLVNGDKIEINNKNIIGIISSSPSIIGDAQSEDWSEKYLKDEFGVKIIKKYNKYKLKDIFIWIDDKNNIYSKLPNEDDLLGDLYTENIDNKEFIKSINEYILNPNYSKKENYIPREQRFEWSPVGLLGKLRVRTSEKITSNKVSADEHGMAINGTDYHVLKTIKEFDGDYGIVQVLFK